MLKIDFKNYKYNGCDNVYPLDKEGDKYTKFGIGAIRKTIAGNTAILLHCERLNSKGKNMLTSKFVTEKGYRFTSLKLRNLVLKIK